MINWNEPVFGDKEKKLVNKVLSSGYVSEGPMTEKLEARLAEIVGTKHVIMTTSCTAAIYLAIEADKKIRDYINGDVIIPDLTFVATKNAVEMAGLDVKIYDVSEDNYCLQDENWMPYVLYMPKIIIPVNLLGRQAMDYIDSEFTVIMDNAGALGSDVTNGKVGCYSLQGNKIISCGQGGFCATDDDDYAEKIRQLKDFGREDKYDNSTTGFNFKFNDILAAVAIGQLDQFEDRKIILTEQYKRYKKELSDYGDFIDYNLTEVPLWVEFDVGADRDELYDYLKSRFVSCRKPWNPISGLPNAKWYSENVLWLPNGPTNDSSNMYEVIYKIKEFFDGV